MIRCAISRPDRNPGQPGKQNAASPAAPDFFVFPENGKVPHTRSECAGFRCLCFFYLLSVFLLPLLRLPLVISPALLLRIHRLAAARPFSVPVPVDIILPGIVVSGIR